MARLYFTQSEGSYAQRTRENAEAADVTVAVAVDFDTPGERATKKYAGDRYMPFAVTAESMRSPWTAGSDAALEFAAQIREAGAVPKGGLTVNFAGNGIGTLLQHGISQESVDRYCAAFFGTLLASGAAPGLKVRSGGQTGFDEGAIVGAIAAGIDGVVHAPNGWKMRGADGRDVSGAEAFKARFTKERILALRGEMARQGLPAPAPAVRKAEGPLCSAPGPWTREAAEADVRTLYVFSDNTDRDSGKNVIPDDSPYAKAYGAGHHYPTVTSAVVRGLPNAVPVSTQRWYHEGAKGVSGRWTDDDAEEFARVIHEEFGEIWRRWDSGAYDRVMFPAGGLFGGKISAITQERTPRLHSLLKAECDALAEHVERGLSQEAAPKEAPAAPAQAAGHDEGLYVLGRILDNYRRRDWTAAFSDDHGVWKRNVADKKEMSVLMDRLKATPLSGLAKDIEEMFDCAYHDAVSRVDDGAGAKAKELYDGFLAKAYPGWARRAEGGYECSTKGDGRFSALVARFKDGTRLGTYKDGIDVSGKTVEDVYQNIIKRSGKGLPPAPGSCIYMSSGTPEEREDNTYNNGYSPLWTIWAEQNEDLVDELRRASAGKVLTDMFASTGVSQARALDEIRKGIRRRFPYEISLALEAQAAGRTQEAPKARVPAPEGGLFPGLMTEAAPAPAPAPSVPFAGLTQESAVDPSLLEGDMDIVDRIVPYSNRQELKESGRTSVKGMVSCRVPHTPSLDPPDQVFAQFDLKVSGGRVLVMAPGTGHNAGPITRFIDRDGRLNLQLMKRRFVERRAPEKDAPSKGIGKKNS